MAQQYSSAQTYNTQYPPNFSPFTPGAGQQMDNGTPSFQPVNAHPSLTNPSPISNQMRYDANANVPPPAPLPFPSHFNPELLKHFPPPPIPPAHFAITPGSVVNLSQFSQGVNTPPTLLPQNYAPFQQPTTPLSGVQSGNRGEAPTQDPRLYGSAVPSIGAHSSAGEVALHTPLAQGPTAISTRAPSFGRSMDGRIDNADIDLREISRADKSVATASVGGGRAYSTEHPLNNFVQPSQPQYPDPSRHAATPNRNYEPKATSRTEMKERAKAALLSLIPHNIRYNDLLSEGVDARVLQQLYGELGLSWQSDAVQSSKIGHEGSYDAKQDDGDKISMTSQHLQQVPSGLRPAVPSVAKVSSAVASLSRPSPTASPSMERKDRIAQLLAAKAGKTVNTPAASQSESPASAVDSVLPNTTEQPDTRPAPVSEEGKTSRPVIQTGMARQKVEQLKKEALSSVKLNGNEYSPHANTSSTETSRPLSISRTDQLHAMSLPTPIKEQIARDGISSLIPGLFMTSDEMEEAHGRNQTSKFAASETYDNAHTGMRMDGDASGILPHPDGHSSGSSRKRSRSSDPSEAVESSRIKLMTTGLDKPTNTDMDMTRDIEDDASEGEIVEGETDAGEPRGQATENTDQNYHDKQTEISAMRKRIAEMEQRQNLKRNQSHALSPAESPTSTPPLTQTLQTAQHSPLSRFPDQPSSTARQDDRISQPAVSLVKATPEQIAERAARLKADFLRQRALRQKQLQDGLPALNDEVVKSQSKLKDSKARLAQVQGELQQYEAEILRARETERQIRLEIENLEKSVSDGMSGQKQFSNELKELKRDTKENVATQSERAPMAVKGRPVSNIVDEPLQQRKTSTPQPAEEIRKLDEDVQTPSESITLMFNDPNESTAHTTNGAQTKPNESAHGAAAADLSATEPALQKLTGTDATVEHEGEPDTLMIATPSNEPAAVSASNSDDSDEVMDESDDTESNDSHMSIDDDSDDSVSMSNSDSEEYEPAEPEEAPELYTKSASEDYEPDLAGEQHYETVQDDEVDEYEPADDISMENGSSTASTSVSAHAISDGQAAPDNNRVEGTIPGLSHDIFQISAAADDLTVDDQEKGLQLSEANTLTKVQNIANVPDAEGLGAHRDGAQSSTRYVPYRSPLSSFKSYRFHPSFSEQVKAGYRSLTYSHKIDPKLPICLKELEGEPCTDPDCQDQHFGSMALSDDKILVQMSSANDIEDKALRDQYLLGLKQVIARLRQEGVKEFSDVANALSEYRRDWTATIFNGS